MFVYRKKRKKSLKIISILWILYRRSKLQQHQSPGSWQIWHISGWFLKLSSLKISWYSMDRFKYWMNTARFQQCSNDKNTSGQYSYSSYDPEYLRVVRVCCNSQSIVSTPGALIYWTILTTDTQVHPLIGACTINFCGAIINRSTPLNIEIYFNQKSVVIDIYWQGRGEGSFKA